MNRRLQALGRLKPGEMNRTEAAYAQLLTGQLQQGEILWWKFEGIKLRLADNCFLTVDFAVMNRAGELQMIDVKGARAVWSDDSKVKMRVAAELYPFPFFVAFPQSKKDGGGFLVEAI